jgi:hypothetical protein
MTTGWQEDELQYPPNETLQPTGAAIPVLRDTKVLPAAPAAELFR